jgi:hypothetical protein
MVAQWKGSHIELFHCLVELHIESLDLFLILRHAKNVLALETKEIFDVTYASTADKREVKTCLSGRFYLLKRAIRLDASASTSGRDTMDNVHD